MPKVSPFALHVHRWRQGCGNDICQRASNVCHMRGELPADVLFVAEAPGESENEMGYPLVGPAGQLLDSIVEQGLSNAPHTLLTPKTCKCDKESGHCMVCDGGLSVCAICGEGEAGLDNPCKLRTAFCNLVGCIPYNESMTKSGEPDLDQVERCSPRLQELVNMASPRLLVCVGKLAWDNLNPRYKQLVTIPKGCKVVEIVHPAAILRGAMVQKPYMIDRCVTILRKAVEEVFNQQTERRDTG